MNNSNEGPPLDREGGVDATENQVANEADINKNKPVAVRTNRAKQVVNDLVELIKQRPSILVILLLSIASLPFLGTLGGGLKFVALRSGGLAKNFVWLKLAPQAKKVVEDFIARARENPQLLVDLARNIESLPLPAKFKPAATALVKVAAFVTDNDSAT